MRKIISSLFVLLIVNLFSACKPESYDTFGDIVGTVIDVETGDVVKQATITLTPTAQNTYTGMDGQFEFLELEAQQYTITVQKDAYETNRKLVNVIAGETTNVSLVMKKK